MIYKKTFGVALSIYCLFFITSCGGGSPGGGVSEFQTVSISASAGTTRLESDVRTGNTCAGGVSTGGTYSTDNVDVDIKSTIYPGVSIAKPVAIDSYSIQYIPNPSLSSSGTPPALASTGGTLLGQTVSAGGSLTIPIAVAPEALKFNLVNNGINPLCVGPVNAYFALITFQAIELGTGTRKTIGPVSLDVVFADRV